MNSKLKFAVGLKLALFSEMPGILGAEYRVVPDHLFGTADLESEADCAVLDLKSNDITLLVIMGADHKKELHRSAPSLIKKIARGDDGRVARVILITAAIVTDAMRTEIEAEFVRIVQSNGEITKTLHVVANRIKS